MRYFSIDDIPRLLKEKQSEMRQKDYAAVIGVSAPFLANVVAGIRTPDVKILDYLGLEDAGQLYRAKGAK